MDDISEGTDQHLAYQSYLLRLWRVDGEDGAVWRGSLESPMTGERVGFGSLDDLFGFLLRQTGLLPGAEAGPADRRTLSMDGAGRDAGADTS